MEFCPQSRSLPAHTRLCCMHLAICPAPYHIAAVSRVCRFFSDCGQSGMQVRAAVQSGAIDCKRFVVTPILFRLTALPMSVVSPASSRHPAKQAAAANASPPASESRQRAEDKARGMQPGRQGQLSLPEGSEQAGSQCPLFRQCQQASRQMPGTASASGARRMLFMPKATRQQAERADIKCT